MITLAKDTIDKDDIGQLIEWLQTYPRLTKGPVTLRLEKKWSQWIGRKYSIFCNSGSSANLLMLAALKEGQYLRNDKIVVPSLAWSTDLSPVMQLGLDPILCDCNMEDLSANLEHVEKIFQEFNPAAFMFVSVLGLVPDMIRVRKLCDEYGVILIEDTCESMGCAFDGKKLGTFGEMSSFSTYFGHHISTIEGGFVSTDNKELYELLLSLRSHGWGRDLSATTQHKLQEEWDVCDFNSLYTFYYPAFNLRSTDLQAFIGLRQIDKLDEWGSRRQENFLTYQSLIDNDHWKPKPQPESFISNFAYPVIHPNRGAMVEELQRNQIEVRPLICGSLGTQPFYVKKYGKLILPNVSQVDKCGFYVPNHPRLTIEQIGLIADIINEEM